MARDRLKWTFDGSEGIPAIGHRRPSQAPENPRSITENDIDVVFQPIVELQSGKLFAYEALVRCKWPKFKNPMKLFEAASAEGSCGRVGRVIRHVAAERAPGERIFVNIHPDELSSRWLVRPDDPLSEHDGEIFLEITETTAFTHFDLVMGVLKEVCQRLGAWLVVDDLGAGYSNLKRVLDLEPKIVKLDRELITGLHANKRQQVMVRHVVQLCTELGALVVAEGIETPDELSAVQDTGAHFAQGFLLAKPAFPLPDYRWNPAWKGGARTITTQIRKSFPPEANSRLRNAAPPKPRRKSARPPPKPPGPRSRRPPAPPLKKR